MTSVKETIQQRHSVRRFKDQAVEEEKIQDLIEAVRLAPSSKNAQPTRLKIIQDQQTKDLFKKEQVFSQDYVYQAPVIIVFAGDPNIYQHPDLKIDHDNKMRLAYDVALAAQNLCLQAVELNLGACYIGLLDRDKIKQVLNIDQKYIIPFAMVLGYPAEEPVVKPKLSAQEIML